MRRSRIRALSSSLLAVLAFLLSTLSFAQKNELSFTVGGVTSSDQTVGSSVCPAIFPSTCPLPISATSDAGVAFEGAFTHQLFRFGPASLDVEVPLVGAPGRDLHFAGSPSGAPVSSLFFTPSARVKFFHSKAISPFANIGGGLAHFGFSGGDRNSGTLEFGGGVDFKTPFPRLALRVQARDFYSGSAVGSSSLVPVSPERQHNVFAGGGIVLRF